MCNKVLLRIKKTKKKTNKKTKVRNLLMLIKSLSESQTVIQTSNLNPPAVCNRKVSVKVGVCKARDEGTIHSVSATKARFRCQTFYEPNLIH